MSSNQVTGGQLLIECLRSQGVDHAFCVPGESYLAALDALHDAPDIKLTVCRQEGGAAMMAEAYGKLTGRPGICFVTRGPGATNASAGLHIGFQDSTPMILFIGQVGRSMTEREAFQELDYRRAFGQLAKWVAQIDEPERIPELVSHAFHTATAGRSGPVVLALPEDMLRERLPAPTLPGRYSPVQAHPGPEDLARLRGLLEAAERPFLILGGRGWDQKASDEMRAFAEAWQLPVGCAFRNQDLFDNTHPCYAGDVGIGPNPELAARIKAADLLLAVGPRLGEMTTGGYSLIDIPEPAQKLVHVHAGAEEIGRVYRPTLGINAGMRAFAAAVSGLKPDAAPGWRAETEKARAAYVAWNEAEPETPGALQMGRVMAWLRGHLDDDTIVCNGAGNYATWVHRFYRFRRVGTQLAPTSGSMGYGVPSAVAAKRAFPERKVVSVNGDGCYMMHGQELATAVHYGLGVIFLVVNNGMYGTIRMHQERHYPARVVGTDLTNPDFAKMAEAYGAAGSVVEKTEDFAAAFEAAEKVAAGGRPALIELRLDPEAITPRHTLSEIRAQGEADKS